MGINIVIYSFCFATLAISMTEHSLADSLAWVLALGLAANGLGQIVGRVVAAVQSALPVIEVIAGGRDGRDDHQR